MYNDAIKEIGYAVSQTQNEEVVVNLMVSLALCFQPFSVWG